MSSATIGSQAAAALYPHHSSSAALSPSQQLQAQAQQAQQMQQAQQQQQQHHQQQQGAPVAMMGPSGLRNGPYPMVPPRLSGEADLGYRLEDELKNEL